MALSKITDNSLNITDLTIADDLTLSSDNAVIKFGADSDVSTATADDNPLLLTLQTGETDLAANDVIGKIAFQAPDEGTGTDAVLVSAAIQARSEGDFAADANATSIDFMTGASGAATTKMSLRSDGHLKLQGTNSLIFGENNTTTSYQSIGGEVAANNLTYRTYQSHIFKNVTGQTSTTDGTEVLKIDANGHVTKPKQPAFLAYPNGDQSNMANDTTMVLDQEIYDQNADYNTSNYTFTAPVTGKYLMCVASRIDNVDTSANWVRIELVTSNRSYSTSLVSPDVSPYMSIDYSIIVDMDASDTCFLRWGQSGGSATADMSDATRWSGALIC